MRSTNIFGSLEEMCGLTHEECASYLGDISETVEAWASGSLDAPAAVVEKLIRLWKRMEDEASKVVDEIDARITNTMFRKLPEFVEFAVPASLEEANELGWPSVGSVLRIAALVSVNTGLNLELVTSKPYYETRASDSSRELIEEKMNEVLLKLAKYGGRSYPTRKIPNGIAFNDVEACSDLLVAFWQTADGVNPIFQEKVIIDGEQFIVVSADVLP